MEPSGGADVLDDWHRRLGLTTLHRIWDHKEVMVGRGLRGVRDEPSCVECEAGACNLRAD